MDCALVGVALVGLVSMKFEYSQDPRCGCCVIGIALADVSIGVCCGYWYCPIGIVYASAREGSETWSMEAVLGKVAGAL